MASATYRTVLACSSTGAPESTAAATLSPGSLPSITRFGMGENVLCSTVSILLIALLVHILTRCRDRQEH